ncbi:MAG: GIY-YIG nuclease family protein [Candidatus Sungbacteria bacterium]|nr:GIY-YIG nuclease family protein [Candidatus Sungbacteria bacterium]
MFPLETKSYEAKSLADSLLGNPYLQVESAELPESGGVYLFRNDANEIVYIGKARNLKRRIRIDHLSQELGDTMSAFRRSINKVLGIPFGHEMKSWICSNCKISFIQIDDPDMRSLVEALLIAAVRSKSLLNHDS